MTLVTIVAPDKGPVAARQGGGLVIPGSEVPYGGFASLLGLSSNDVTSTSSSESRDIYLLGAASNGLQLARVSVDDMTDYTKFVYFNPDTLAFSYQPPAPNITDVNKLYVPGTFTSGSVFYSQ